MNGVKPDEQTRGPGPCYTCPRPFTNIPPPPPPSQPCSTKNVFKNTHKHTNTNANTAHQSKALVCARLMNLVGTIFCLPPPETRCPFRRNSPTPRSLSDGLD